ncbi:MAG TPA: DUF2147 domain-containing protein [Sphingomicrobium sp.]|nr:DUF2147 domain-containing protein [Sphingomicrobium sp.]
MKRYLIAFGAFLAAAAPAGALAKGGLEGRWKNGHMEIVIAPCGEALCGTVVKASPKQQAKAEHGSGTDLVGARLITNIHPTGPQTYKANVYLADRDTHASGTIRQVGPNRLNVKGCVLLIICKSKNWDRVGG